MKKQKIRNNYNGRRFVWLAERNVNDYFQHEHDMCRTYFAFKSFTYKECRDLIIKVIKLRPQYLSSTGKDHSRLEAGCRFRTLLDLGVIVEVK